MSILYDADGNEYEVDLAPEQQQQQQETPNVRQMREQIKTLEAAAKRVTDLESENQKLTRNETLRTAGLDLDEVQRRALEAAHEGDWTPDAVRATAVQLKWIAPPDPKVAVGEQEAHGRMQAAFTGGVTTPPDPEIELDGRLAQAKNADEFMQMYRESGRPLT